MLELKEVQQDPLFLLPSPSLVVDFELARIQTWRQKTVLHLCAEAVRTLAKLVAAPIQQHAQRTNNKKRLRIKTRYYIEY